MERSDFLGLDSSEDIPNFTNHDISDINIKCDICTTQLWNYAGKNIAIERTKYSSEGLEQN